MVCPAEGSSLPRELFTVSFGSFETGLLNGCSCGGGAGSTNGTGIFNTLGSSAAANLH